MKSNYKLLQLVIGCGLMLSFTIVEAQLYVGNGGDVFISSGEQIFINGNLDVTNGAMITDKSTIGLNLTGIANLSGIMEYTALGNQLILPFNHQILRISGTGSKMLTAGINIGSNLQLGGTAKLITGNYILSLIGGSSTISGVPAFGNNAGSWIVTGNGTAGPGNTGIGGLKIAGIGVSGRTNPVMFPVGPTPGRYNPVMITNAGTTDDFAVAVNDQPVPGAPSNETVLATWKITETDPGGSLVTLGTQWDAADEAAGFIRTICGIVHSDGTVIDYFASAGAASGTSPYTQTGGGFTSFSPFGLTSNAVVLPVSFISIKGLRKGTSIRVDWEVADELSIKYYEVQKSSSGTNFSDAGQLAATGNNNGQLSYNWLDRNPFTGVNFYRVRSVGLNGSYKYSNIVKVDFAINKSSISAYPNPVVNSKLALEFNNKPAGTYFIKITGLSGQIVYEKKILHNGVDQDYPLQLPPELARSMYQVNIEGPDGKKTILQLMVHY